MEGLYLIRASFDNSQVQVRKSSWEIMSLLGEEFNPLGRQLVKL